MKITKDGWKKQTRELGRKLSRKSTYQKLAAETGLSYTTVRNFCAVGNGSFRTLISIAEAAEFEVHLELIPKGEEAAPVSDQKEAAPIFDEPDWTDGAEDSPPDMVWNSWLDSPGVDWWPPPESDTEKSADAESADASEFDWMD